MLDRERLQNNANSLCTVTMTESITRAGPTTILSDPAVIETPRPELFDKHYWQQKNAITGTAGGRGTALFIQRGATEWVLRHCCRGGLIGKIIADSYVWLGLSRSRVWREWRLLDELRKANLPVPRPIAAAVHRRGLLYRADIITDRVPNAAPLSDTIEHRSLPAQIWKSIGQTVRRMHDLGVWHADLNAHNILIANEQVWLIDFDRGRIRAEKKRWKDSNLARLRRSLDKISTQQPALNFAESDWHDLLAGYSSPDQ